MARHRLRSGLFISFEGVNRYLSRIAEGYGTFIYNYGQREGERAGVLVP